MLPRLPPGCLLLTLDVSSLYTNIPHEEGITASEEFLNLQEEQKPPTTDLWQQIRLVLMKNSFVFNENNYLQVHGTTMGTRMAPSYDNLFMRKLEQEFLQTQDKIPRVWWTYIDDIFAIWDHDEPSLKVFIENINHHHPTIKFTALWSNKEVTFQNTRLYLRDDQIDTDLHVKPTNTHQYPRMDSCHPQHYKTSIPYSQVLHLRRICLEDEHLQKWTRELKKHLLKWGYCEQQLSKKIHRALTLRGMIVCSHILTKRSLLEYRWWSHTIQFCNLSKRSSSPTFLPFIPRNSYKGQFRSLR